MKQPAHLTSKNQTLTHNSVIHHTLESVSLYKVSRDEATMDTNTNNKEDIPNVQATKEVFGYSIMFLMRTQNTFEDSGSLKESTNIP